MCTFVTQVPVPRHVGLNAVIGLGDFQGGQLWTALDVARRMKRLTSLGADGAMLPDSQGVMRPDVLLPARHRATIFDPKVYHTACGGALDRRAHHVGCL